jgi:hypothetical protein
VLHPVRAKMVKRPDDWKWSSYLATAGSIKTPEYLTIDWLLGQFGSKRKAAQKRYKKFVMEGISNESPWEGIQGQVILGGERFVEKFKDLLADKEKLKEIPRHQRYTGRPSLSALFRQGKTKDERNKKIRTAHLKLGYTLKEIADCLGIHYTTVSKVLLDKK